MMILNFILTSFLILGFFISLNSTKLNLDCLNKQYYKKINHQLLNLISKKKNYFDFNFCRGTAKVELNLEGNIRNE